MGFPAATPEYQKLKVIDKPMGLVYGPVTSRRFGASLGINLLGANKICSFDCPYCELGFTEVRMNQLKDEGFFPRPEQVGEALRVQLRALLDKSATVDWLAVSGNGEPTLHPLFFECIEEVLRARSDLVPQTPIAVLTNGAHCDNRRVIQGLDLVDERVFKVDAGSDQVLKSVNRPLVRASLTKLTANARKLKDITIQSLFVQGAVDNTRIEHIEEWMEVIGMIRPKNVQITTLDRVPAAPGLVKVDEDTLYTIASRLKRKLQVDCAVFP